MYDAVLRSTIVASMTGVTANNIVDLVITSSGQRSAVNQRLRATSLGTVELAYTVSILNVGSVFTYIALAEQLKTAVSSGQFAATLQSLAATAGAIGMTETTSEPVRTVNTSPSDVNNINSNDATGLSIGAIVGIVIAALVVLALLVGGVYYCTVRKADPGKLL